MKSFEIISESPLLIDGRYPVRVLNMALLIGQSIDGRELEQATSPWPPDRFASMCDTLAWAASGRQCTSLPSFTTRVNAKDAGIDAEWRVELPDNGRSVPTPILGPGLNVFQYKKRDLMAQDRRRIISQLKSSLREAIHDLIERNKRLPDRYILFVNIDLKHNDKAALKESIIRIGVLSHTTVIAMPSQSRLTWSQVKPTVRKRAEAELMKR